MYGFEAMEHSRNTIDLKKPIIALTADVATVDVGKYKVTVLNSILLNL